MQNIPGRKKNIHKGKELGRNPAIAGYFRICIYMHICNMHCKRLLELALITIYYQVIFQIIMMNQLLLFGWYSLDSYFPVKYYSQERYKRIVSLFNKLLLFFFPLNTMTRRVSFPLDVINMKSTVFIDYKMFQNLSCSLQILVWTQCFCFTISVHEIFHQMLNVSSHFLEILSLHFYFDISVLLIKSLVCDLI